MKNLSLRQKEKLLKKTGYKQFRNTNYYANREGDIFNIKNMKKSNFYLKNDYYYISICNNGNRKDYRVNRIIAELFCNNKDLSKVVDHINFDKLDNRAENLRWITQKENVRSYFKSDLYKEKMGKLTTKNFINIRENCKKELGINV